MPWNSTPILARTLLPYFLFAFALSMGACDLLESGSDSDNPPDWVGNWEVVDVQPDSQEPPDEYRFFYSISEDKIETFTKPPDQECSIDSVEIINVDGNVITTEDDDGEQTEARLETSGETLTITPIDSEAEVEKLTAEYVESDPRDILGCASSSVRERATGNSLVPDASPGG